MKKHYSGILALMLVGFVGVTVALTAIFSSAQPPSDLSPGLIDNPGLAQARLDAWYNKRIPHPACPNCYKVDSGLPGIFEKVPDTDHVISRDIPDPAPLELGEIRPAYHPETGEPLWYKGRQAFVGPTDEEPVSASLPVPLIEVKRIKYRHEAELFKIEGVHAVGIGEKGLLVDILPEKNANRRLIPSAIEGIPVVVEETGVPQLISHEFEYYRPVPVGAGFNSTASTGGFGTLGPHLSRDLSDGIGYCCQLYTLTAGHVIQEPSFPNSNVNNQRVIRQPSGYPYGYVAYMFQLLPCAVNNYVGCLAAGYPVNDTRVRPDTAAIGHDGADYYPMSSPCNGAAKPVRRMQYGVTLWKSGPSGIIRIPTFSNCTGQCFRVWGAYTHRVLSSLRSTETTSAPSSATTVYYIYPVDTFSPATAVVPGDSGALVSWDATRDVAGLLIARNVDLLNPSVFYYGIYQRLDYIKTAFYNVGASFDHYWGTAGTASRPSSSAQDNPC